MNQADRQTSAAHIGDNLELVRCVRDARGALCVVQANHIKYPMEIKRVFWICDVPKGAVRGEHANRNCTELLIAVNGSVRLWLTDGKTECEVKLDSPSVGIYIPPMVWCRLYDFSADCVCLCLADQDYDESQYINQYEDFLRETANASHSL
jgi:dTDP-4-dehydrorhamnose 3,5-epimerase-like enzyme